MAFICLFCHLKHFLEIQDNILIYNISNCTTKKGSSTMTFIKILWMLSFDELKRFKRKLDLFHIISSRFMKAIVVVLVRQNISRT